MPIENGKNIALIDFSDKFRKTNKAKNTYNENNEYRAGHPNAKSDGDEKGKGENNGSIGSKTDIATRKSNLAKNFYNKDNQYDASKVK